MVSLRNKIGFICFSLIAFLQIGSAYAQKGYKLKLLSHWQNENLYRLNGYQIWNDLTGYVDSVHHREYIIAGSIDSIYFFDITDPTQIKLCDAQHGRSWAVVNRDYECYSHYAYCVSDNNTPGALQVFDLQYLPDSVHKVYDSDSLSFNTHSIFIDAKSKRLYLCINRLKSGGVAAMDIMSLENPEKPTWIGRLQVPTFGDGATAFRNVHEVYVRNDTAYCSVEYNGIWIFDLRDLKKQSLISVIRDYPENGYNHSSYLDKSGRFLMFTDEIPNGLSVKIYDIKDIHSPKLASMYQSNKGATAHNAFWKGGFAYVSSYHDGLYIYNLFDPFHPYVEAYYHTSPWPPSSYEGFKGCWGVYPFFPSGVIAASDMGEGIFVFKPDTSLTGLDQPNEKEEINIFPNPFSGKIQIEFPKSKIEPLDFKVYSANGELLLHRIISEPTFEADLSEWNIGIYFVYLSNNRIHQIQKLIKTN